MISGHYLGEIFRQIVHEMIDEGVLFLGQVRLTTECIDTYAHWSRYSEHIQARIPLRL